MSLLIRNGLVLASAHDEPRPLDILLDGALISEVGRQLHVPPDAKILDASGHLIIPGLINAHVHGRENLLKGLVDNRPLEAWLLELAALSDERSPEDQYVSVALGAIEMLRRIPFGCLGRHFHSFHRVAMVLAKAMSEAWLDLSPPQSRMTRVPPRFRK